jgi:uncharacterized protein
MNLADTPRLASVTVETRLAAAPVLLLTGARGVGKHALLAQLLPAHATLSLDDLTTLADARAAPDALVRRAPRLKVREAQPEPAVLAAAVRAARESPGAGGVVLTASAEMEVAPEMEDVVARVRLWPLTRSERLGLGVGGLWGDLLDSEPDGWYELVQEVGGEEANWREEVAVGGFPALVDREEREREEWLADRVNRWLEHDLRELSSIDDLLGMHRLMRAACGRLGEVANQAELSRETGISAPTVYRYLKLLEASYQLVRLEPYPVPGTRRTVRTPKLYWVDPALALFLGGGDAPRAGHLENLVLGDLLAWRDAQLAPAALHYWRTHQGEEVDFVVEQGGRLLAVEVRATSQLTTDDARDLHLFRRQHADRFLGALVLHTGEETYWLSDGVLAVPWWRVL